MKNLLFSLIILLTLTACEISTNTSNESLLSSMKIDENGLKCSDVYLEIDEEKVDRTTFSYGEEVFFSFNNVKGFKKKNGKVYPGLGVEIKNTNNKEVILESEDLFPNDIGFSETVILLYSNITMALPYKDNEEYNIKIKIWDKEGDGVLKFEMPFTINENEDLDVKSKDVTYSALYLWNGDQNKLVANDNVSRKDQLLLIYEGLDGFKVEKGLVFPGLSLKLIDDDGEIIIDEDNLMGDYTYKGTSFDQFNKQLYFEIDFFYDKYANPLQLTTKLWDEKSNSKLTLRTEIEVH